jgi:ParB/RepB/Spo0J family partition protein
MPSEILELDATKIVVKEGRFREVMDPHELELLKTSILKLGQIQPIVISREMELVAGERRLVACRQLHREVNAVYADQVDELMLKEMELHENLYRADLTPAETVIAKQEIHNIWVEEHGDPRDIASMEYGAGHTQADTARKLGQSRSLLTSELAMAKLIPHVPEMKKAKTMAEMKKIAKKLEKQAEWHIESKAAHEVLEREGKILGEGKAKSMTREDVLKGKVAAWNKRLMQADAMEMLKSEELFLGPPNIVFFDPPWGVELHEKVEAGLLTGDAYEDTKEKFEETFPTYCQLLYKIMRPDSHLYCFFGIVHYSFVYSSLADAGFEVNGRPIVWVKPGIHSTRQPDKWPGAGYEPIAFARKGTRDLVGKLPDSITDIKPLSPNEKKGHPSAKPWEVYDNLLKRSAMPGDVILDPMYGSGAAFVACEMNPKLRPLWYGWELDKKCRGLAMLNLLEALGVKG